LGEGLALGESSEMGGETERLGHRQEALDNRHRSTCDLFFFIDNTSPLIETVVDSSHGVLGGSDFTSEDRFLQSRAGSQFRSIVTSSSSLNQLTSSSVDGIGMEHHIHNVESNTSHVLFTHHTFLGSPLESIFTRILDFVHELDSLSSIYQNTGTLVLWAERPDLKSISLVPFEFFNKDFSSDLWVISGAYLFSLNHHGEFFLKGLAFHVKSVVLVRRLSHHDLVTLFSYSLTIGYDRVGLNQFDVGVFVLEIVQTDFNVQFTTTGDNVFT